MIKIIWEPIQIIGGLEDEDILLRYMPYPKFKALFHVGLKFTRADNFTKDDHFEGEFVEQIYRAGNIVTVLDENGEPLKTAADSFRDECHKTRELSYVSCWNFSNTESMALWRIYGGGNNALAIKTSISKIKKALEVGTYNGKLTKHLKKRIVQVEYIDHQGSDVGVPRKQIRAKGAEILFYKNVAYEYEKEVRIIIDGADQGSEAVAKEIGLECTVLISPEEFIDEIIVSPLADAWFFDLVQHEMGEHGLADAVKWSSLKFRPGQLLSPTGVKSI